MTDFPIEVDDAPVDAGMSDTVSGQVDYFAFDTSEIHYLPDGVSWVQIKVFNEGERRAYQNKVNKDVKIHRATQDMSLKLAPGDERYELLNIAITDWHMVRNGKPFPFSPNARKDFLNAANPKVVDEIEVAVREVNTWLGNEMTAEGIKQEIDRLEEQLAKKLEEEAGK